jgi:alpha-beta hydrolase superfamily lysophospholipase
MKADETDGARNEAKPKRHRFVARVALVAGVLSVSAALAASQAPVAQESLSLRGHEQSLYVCGSPSDFPVIVSSGDGGWIHLGPHVAQFLCARGYYVIGFDVRAYLESFTGARAGLRPEDEPRDYFVLADFARRRTGRKPLLIGVSEGAGLSVLAATDPQTKGAIAGVIGLGLPNMNELAWRWRDAVIYLTHKVPNEPSFSTADVVRSVAPAPLAAIHSTHDEFVSLPEVTRIMNAAQEPKRLWVVTAADHRFSDNVAGFDHTLLDAIDWVKAHSAG